MVPSVSWARAGATSTETKPSPPSGRVVHRPEDGQGVVDVVHDQVPVGVLDRLGRDQCGELVVVGVLALDGLGEDGRVGGDPPDALVDQAGQRAVLQPVPPQVVEPRALALLVGRDRGAWSWAVLSSGAGVRCEPVTRSGAAR